MIGLIILATVIGVLVIWFIGYYKYEKYLHTFPGPRQFPIVGSALEFNSTADFLPKLVELATIHGGIMKFKLGFEPPSLFVTDCKLLEYILSSTKILQKSEDYTFLHKWLGTGLLTSSGEKWRKHRKILTPAFHFQILEQFVDVFDSFSKILVDKLAQEVEKDSTDIYPYISLCSLDAICAAAMGTTVNAQRNHESEYVRAVTDMCRIFADRTLSMIKIKPFLYQFSRDYQKEQKYLKILHKYTYDVINARKKELFDSGDMSTNTNYDEIGRQRRKAFLDLLLQYKYNDAQALTDENIREEVDTFMFEEKVLEELHSIFEDDKTRDATYRDLQEMKYLEAVIKETLRLYPAVPIYARKLEEDVIYDGKVLPKNISLAILAYGIHRDPKIYPDPERFDPERFTTTTTNRSPYAYIPFSAGPRNCIGQRFAMLEMKSVISKVLQNYELDPVPGHQIVVISEATIKSKTGMCVKLRKRQF